MLYVFSSILAFTFNPLIVVVLTRMDTVLLTLEIPFNFTKKADELHRLF